MENNLSVSDLNSYIKGVFDDELVLHNLSVYGELFQYSVSGGNTYFTLKENDCYLQCLKYGRIEKPEIGAQLTVFGSVEFYRKAGKVTFIAKRVEETGKGKQFADFLAMKEKLSAEGLFINKCIIPEFIHKIAIVTSNRGAVIHDFLSVLANHQYLDVNVIQTKVQGDNADESLSQAILEADNTNSDVIVIARGGGSAVDLDCFNSEKVVRAIAKCKTATLSAVGHQTDYTLCDLASTQRAGTPSIAGEIICKINDTVITRFTSAVDKIKTTLQNKVTKNSSYLYFLSSKIINSSEKYNEKQKYNLHEKLNGIKTHCLTLINKSENAIRQSALKENASLTNKYMGYDKKLTLSIANLEFNNPLKILSQGYALVLKNGTKINSRSQLKNGDIIDVKLYDGQFRAEIKGENNEI